MRQHRCPGSQDTPCRRGSGPSARPWMTRWDGRHIPKVRRPDDTPATTSHSCWPWRRGRLAAHLLPRATPARAGSPASAPLPPRPSPTPGRKTDPDSGVSLARRGYRGACASNLRQPFGWHVMSTYCMPDQRDPGQFVTSPMARQRKAQVTAALEACKALPSREGAPRAQEALPPAAAQGQAGRTGGRARAPEGAPHVLFAGHSNPRTAREPAWAAGHRDTRPPAPRGGMGRGQQTDFLSPHRSLPPQGEPVPGHWAAPGTSVVVVTGRGTTGTQRAGPDAAEHPAVHRASPTAKNCCPAVSTRLRLRTPSKLGHKSTLLSAFPSC